MVVHWEACSIAVHGSLGIFPLGESSHPQGLLPENPIAAWLWGSPHSISQECGKWAEFCGCRLMVVRRRTACDHRHWRLTTLDDAPMPWPRMQIDDPVALSPLTIRQSLPP